MQHQISSDTFTILLFFFTQHFQYEKQKKEGQVSCNAEAQEKKVLYIYMYIYMKHIYIFKLTVKYEHIYTEFYKVVKATKLFATSP